jgi:heme/copper-type cytochrome/quinol oxidase subunit 3
MGSIPIELRFLNENLICIKFGEVMRLKVKVEGNNFYYNKSDVRLLNQYSHPYHLVTPSRWPFVMSVNLFSLVISGIMYLHAYEFGGGWLIFSFLGVIFVAYAWWVDIIFEATIEGAHTTYVQRGLRIGMILFIISEVLFFFAFFRAFFHSSVSPAIEIGAVWPPLGIDVFNPWEIPFLNTLILLLSGTWATLAHHIIKYSLHLYFRLAEFALFFAIVLGILFTCFQVYEYIIASFSISDSIYGSIFYLATGFHGLHVLIGTIFLIIMYYRLRNNHFFLRFHFGVDAAVWYWHFVDVVWLFLFVTIYWWGS